MRWNKEWGVMEYAVGDVVTIQDTQTMHDKDIRGCEFGICVNNIMVELGGKKATIHHAFAPWNPSLEIAYYLVGIDWTWTSEMFVNNKKNKYCTRQMDALSIYNNLTKAIGYQQTKNMEAFINAYRKFDFDRCRTIWRAYTWNDFENRLIWNMLECVRPGMENTKPSVKVPIIDSYFIKFNGTH